MRTIGLVAGLAACLLALPAAAAANLDRTPIAGVVARTVPGDCAIADSASAPCASGGASADLMIVDPANPDRKASTTALSLLVPPDSHAIMTAYDAAGRLLGVADRMEGDDGGERLSLTGLGDIARVHISGRGPIAYADLQIAEPKTPSRLPEPATWAMLIAGFGIIAGVVRRCIRRSEARFTERVRQIAAGEQG